MGREKQAKVDAAPEAARAIAWKAQARVSARFHHLTRRNTLSVVVATAVARELADFVWAIGQAVRPTTTAHHHGRCPLMAREGSAMDRAGGAV